MTIPQAPAAAADIGATYLADVVTLLHRYKALAEGAFAQVDDRALLVTLDEESNSIAHIVKHLRGNMLSRWTDFLTTDGEKPDRHRDTEFEIEPGLSRETIVGWWEEGWARLFDALGALTPSDLALTVRVRGEAMSVVSAIDRQIAHYAYHVGQIVFLAKHLRAGEWRTLSIPRAPRPSRA